MLADMVPVGLSRQVGLAPLGVAVIHNEAMSERIIPMPAVLPKLLSSTCRQWRHEQ
jgi:hypothetical protein